MLVGVITQKPVPEEVCELRAVSTWHDCLVAGHTLGGELVAVAVAAHQRVVLVGEGLVCQRAVAAETAEAVLVVVSVLVEELLEEEESQWAAGHCQSKSSSYPVCQTDTAGSETPWTVSEWKQSICKEFRGHRIPSEGPFSA